MRSIFLLLILQCFLDLPMRAQDKVPVKFGSVTADDFRQVYPIDSSAAAVIIADVGQTRIVGNTKGFFSWEFVHYRRVHIRNKTAFDVSTVTIPLYSSGNYDEELVKIKAQTYNLVNGEVVETKFDSKKGVFKDQIDPNWVLRKFTMPDVKEGSILEFEYTVKSDLLEYLRPWTFQGSYPRLWSEYNVSIPRFISYIMLTQGYLEPYIREKKDGSDYFSITISNGASAARHLSFTDFINNYRWVYKDVPQLKEENYTSTLQNHVAQIEFHLSEFKDPLVYQNVIGSWPEQTRKLLNAEYFGADLGKQNGWLKDIMDPIIDEADSPLEMARNIYRYVQTQFTCTQRKGFAVTDNIRNIARTKKGTVAELNLLLTAMMRYANILADPVILSTKSHGYTYSLYPLLKRFNYTICRVMINDRYYYLDASNSELGFGRLGPECYNGHARVVDPLATPINFSADSLLERKITSVLMINNDKGGMLGKIQKTPGYFESYNLRRKINSAGLPGYISELEKGFMSEIQIMEPSVDSMDLLEMPVKLEYGFEIPQSDEDVMYFNPMMTEAWKENPFKAAQRYYPVEMPYTIDETYLLRMDVPRGFEVDEMPKQIRMKLNENDDGFFEYLISNSNGVISMRCRLRLSRTYFMPEEYEMLREFFAMVVQKQGEQIVFRKKN